MICIPLKIHFVSIHNILIPPIVYLYQILLKYSQRYSSYRTDTKSLQYTLFNYAKHNLSFTITKTCPYNFDPLKPHFYIVKLGFTEVYIIFLISAQKQRLWVLVRTASAVLTRTHNLCFEQKYEKYQNFFIWKFSFFGSKIFNIFE